MPIKVYKPTTPARRKTSIVDWHDLTRKRPEKKLTKSLKQNAGRSKGRISVRHRGGGHKRLYRLIDFKRQRFDEPARVIAIEYDPNRSARIALVQYEDGDKAYILATESVKVGDLQVSSEKQIKAVPGNRMPLKYIPLGMSVHNVEFAPGQGGRLVRSAGQRAIIMTSEGNMVQLKMPSGEIRLIPSKCAATIGYVSNPDHGLVRIGKAGRNRHMGIRPTVLGKSMNPVDHPHGGGEGHQPIGMKAPKTPWGKKAIGVQTRKKGKASNKMILKRRKGRKRR